MPVNPTATATQGKPAECLKGMTITGLTTGDQWHVDDIINRPPQATGGHFSVGYSVSNTKDNSIAFLKAIDFSAAMQHQDTLTAMKAMLDSYLFERDLLLVCKDKRMDKISIPIDHGQINLPQFGMCQHVYFLIFPMANGDIRSLLARSNGIDLACKFRYLHHAANGVKQLHDSAIAHQDIKPSNLLLFPDENGKLADLGRSHAAGLRVPHAQVPVAGDMTYAPFELLFNISVDEETRRYGCDVYLLGSLMLFMLSGVTATASMLSYIRNGQVTMASNVRTYDEILPYLLKSYELTMAAFESNVGRMGMNKRNQEMTIQICRELIHPDHTRRGDLSQGGEPKRRFSMERYITRFNLLSERMRYGA